MYICIQIDVTSTSHIATYPMNMRGFLSSIPPFVYQFTDSPFAHSNIGVFRIPEGVKLLILLLLPWPFWIKVSWIAALLFGQQKLVDGWVVCQDGEECERLTMKKSN